MTGKFEDLKAGTGNGKGSTLLVPVTSRRCMFSNNNVWEGTEGQNFGNNAMKHFYVKLMMLTVLMSMVGIRIFAHDYAVENTDGKTIYYNNIARINYCGRKYL